MRVYRRETGRQASRERWRHRPTDRHSGRQHRQAGKQTDGKNDRKEGHTHAARRHRRRNRASIHCIANVRAPYLLHPPQIPTSRILCEVDGVSPPPLLCHERWKTVSDSARRQGVWLHRHEAVDWKAVEASCMSAKGWISDKEVALTWATELNTM